jgi:hypothetical protein
VGQLRSDDGSGSHSRTFGPELFTVQPVSQSFGVPRVADPDPDPDPGPSSRPPKIPCLQILIHPHSTLLSSHEL